MIYRYADASFADTILHRHSSVGHVFLLNGAAISWHASRPSLIVLNAAEAELYSLSSATQEAIYHQVPQSEHQSSIPTKQFDYYERKLSGSSRLIQRKQLLQSK